MSKIYLDIIARRSSKKAIEELAKQFGICSFRCRFSWALKILRSSILLPHYKAGLPSNLWITGIVLLEANLQEFQVIASDIAFIRESELAGVQRKFFADPHSLETFTAVWSTFLTIQFMAKKWSSKEKLGHTGLFMEYNSRSKTIALTSAKLPKLMKALLKSNF